LALDPTTSVLFYRDTIDCLERVMQYSAEHRLRWLVHTKIPGLMSPA